jgi:hypothetical protein
MSQESEKIIYYFVMLIVVNIYTKTACLFTIFHYASIKHFFQCNLWTASQSYETKKNSSLPNLCLDQFRTNSYSCIRKLAKTFGNPDRSKFAFS